MSELRPSLAETRGPEDLPAPRSRVWWLAVVGRVLVLALGVCSLATALRQVPVSDRLAASERYSCPMHPEVSAHSPGACPICGMALERARGLAPAPEDAPDRAGVAPAVRRVFRETVRAAAWVDASGEVVAALYRDDLVGLLPGASAVFFPSAAPSVGVDVALAAGVEDWDSSTARARFTAAGDAAPRPGDHGSLVIAERARELLVVPPGALVSSPAGPCVLVRDAATQRLARRPVQIGRAHQGGVAILSGLTDGEPVAVGNAFFLDAELPPEAAR